MRTSAAWKFTVLAVAFAHVAKADAPEDGSAPASTAAARTAAAPTAAAPTAAAPTAATGAVRLDYRAPSPACPGQPEFEKRVHNRAGAIRFDSSAGAGPVLRIEAAPHGTDWQVTLRLVGPEGHERLRELIAPTCDEAIDGVALIAAVTLGAAVARAGAAKADGANANGANANGANANGANADGANRDGASAHGTRVEGARAARAEPRDVTGAPMQGAAAAPEAGASPPAAEARPLAPEPRSAPRVTLAAGAMGLLGVAPRVLIGAEVATTVAWKTQGSLAPAVRIAAGRTARASSDEIGGVARFSMTLATLEACPLRLGASWLAVEPCALAAAGVLDASGSDTFAPESHTRSFWALGSSLSMILGPTGPIEWTARAALAFPLRRDAFEFTPQAFFSTPVAVGLLSLEAGVGFP